jgi:hypothetical protein
VLGELAAEFSRRGWERRLKERMGRVGRGRSSGWARFFSFFFASWVCLKLEEPLGKKAVCFGLTGGVRGTAGPTRSGCGHGACWTVLCAMRAACCSERSEEGEERWAEKRA